MDKQVLVLEFRHKLDEAAMAKIRDCTTPKNRITPGHLSLLKDMLTSKGGSVPLINIGDVLDDPAELSNEEAKILVIKVAGAISGIIIDR